MGFHPKMVVRVDELRRWGSGTRQTCHLTADSEEELFAFAKRLGIPRCYLHRGSVLHFDLPAKWRQIALQEGAEFLSAKEQARLRRGRR